MEPANAQGKQLKRLWDRLPDSALTESELLQAIFKATNIREGDFATAKTIRVSLGLARALFLTDDGRYIKAEAFPEWPDNAPGTPAYNAHLRQMAEAEEQRHRENDAAKSRDAENQPWNIERKQRLAELDQRVAAAVAPLRDEIDALRAEIAALREQLAVTEVVA